MPRHLDVTGLVLAGGEGRRMGGLDKGLQNWRDMALVDHVIRRLSPQVGPLLISANRHLDRYGQRGHPVVPDTLVGHQGPLAGVLAGLQSCTTPWMVTAPCDGPRLPLDLVDRLMNAAKSTGSALAMAETQGKYQPVFSLVHASLAPKLLQFLAKGGRKFDRWTLSQGACLVPFEHSAAFVNANTLADLQAMDEDFDA